MNFQVSPSKESRDTAEIVHGYASTVHLIIDTPTPNIQQL